MEHFKVYKPETNMVSTQIAETLFQYVGEGGSFRPITRKNYLDDSKCVTLLASKAPNKDGEVATTPIVLAREISDLLRGKQIHIEEIGNLPVFEFDTGDGSEPMVLVNFPLDPSSMNAPSVAVTKAHVSAKQKLPKRTAAFDWASVMSY